MADGRTPNPDAPLYQGERWGDSFSYTFSGLPSGYYQLTLKSTELFNWTTRQTDVAVNGTKVLAAFNTVADTGGLDRSDDKVITNVAVPASGQLTVAFAKASTSQTQAKVSAVAVEPQWGMSTADLTSQLFLLAVQGHASLPVLAAQLRYAGNDTRLNGGAYGALQVIGDDTIVNGRRSSLVVSGNRILSGEEASYGAAVSISSVSRCVMTRNMVVYDDNSYAGGVEQVALSLDNTGLFPGQGNNGFANSTSAAVSITGNILQGTMSILPAAMPQGQNVPGLPNMAGFLNTLLP